MKNDSRKPEDIHTWKAYLECECSTKEHLFVLEYDQEWGLTFSLQRHQWRGFFRRLWEATKYVFGKGCLGWETSIIKPTDIPKVREWIAQVDQYGIGEDFEAEIDEVEKLSSGSDLKQ